METIERYRRGIEKMARRETDKDEFDQRMEFGDGPRVDPELIQGVDLTMRIDDAQGEEEGRREVSWSREETIPTDEHGTIKKKKWVLENEDKGTRKSGGGQ